MLRYYFIAPNIYDNSIITIYYSVIEVVMTHILKNKNKNKNKE